MSKILTEVLSANQAYAASFGKKGELALPPARRFAVLTCMDARLDPAKYAGLAEGDAHVILSNMPGGGKVIKAEVPLSEMFGYSTTLRSMSQGRATFTMQFDHYAEAPANVSAEVQKKFA